MAMNRVGIVGVRFGERLKTAYFSVYCLFECKILYIHTTSIQISNFNHDGMSG